MCALAVVAYVNALGNGFAFDDNLIIVANPVVTGARWGEALLGPWWFGSTDGGGLFRPLTLTSFTLEWGAWSGSPFGFHLVSVLAHAVVSLLVFLVLARLASRTAALAGAILFAVHPVHVEAVANVVGRGEIYAAMAVLAASLVYLDEGLRHPSRRPLRLAALCALYLAALGSKEGGAVLPGLLALLELTRRDGRPWTRRLAEEAPVYVALAGVLAGYLLVRTAVLGAVTGGGAAPEFIGVTTGERLLTAVTLWPEYLRLLLFPLDLSADYAPAVLLVSRSVNAAVVAGAFILGGLAFLAWFSSRHHPLVTLGIGWFFVAVLPVSNLLFPAGILLAERTLYLPSVGASLALAGGWNWAEARLSPAQARRWVAAGAVAMLALLARTVDRNPSWFSTYTVMNTLAQDHPESAIALRTRAMGLERVGERAEAARLWRTVLALQPNHYGFLVEASRFFFALGERATASDLLGRAIALRPSDPSAYRALAEQRLLAGDGREAHRVALAGLAVAEAGAPLWSLVSESYVAKGDLDASLRARRAALGADPGSASDWDRLGDVLEALDRMDEARDARARAASLRALEPATTGPS